MSQHTPGPWEASGHTVYDTSMVPVASVHSAADAHLIAAAPDMLTALHQAFSALSSHDPDWPYMRAIRAVLAKAKGRS